MTLNNTVSIDSPWIKPDRSASEVFSKLGPKRLYGPREIIYSQGQSCTGLYYLHRGKVKVTILFADGNEKILSIQEAPAIFGETASFDGGPCFNTAFAVSTSEISFIPAKKVTELILEYPEVSLALLRSLSRKIRLLALQVEDMSSLTIRGRIAHMLLKLGNDYGIQTDTGIELQMPVTHEELANVVGTSRPIVTAILNDFAKKGLIRKRRCRITLCDLEGLEKMIPNKGIGIRG